MHTCVHYILVVLYYYFIFIHIDTQPCRDGLVVRLSCVRSRVCASVGSQQGPYYKMVTASLLGTYLMR